MKLTINGVEQEESELKGETLEAILDMMVKNAPGSYTVSYTHLTLPTILLV